MPRLPFVWEVISNSKKSKTMKKVDFSRLQVEYPIGVFTTYDARTEIGNLIYKEAATLEIDSLARKIHWAKEEQPLELTDEEMQYIKDYLKKLGVSYYFIAAIERQAAGTKIESKDNDEPKEESKHESSI